MVKFVVGLHSHRHGTSTYLFRISDDSTFTEADFIAVLGEDWEPDREEYVELTEFALDEVVHWTKEK